MSTVGLARLFIEWSIVVITFLWLTFWVACVVALVGGFFVGSGLIVARYVNSLWRKRSG